MSTFLRSTAPPHATPYERVVHDHEQGGIRVPLAGPRVFAPLAPTGGKASSPSRRTKLWELTTMLHCSIIGTCLGTGELRDVMRRTDPDLDRHATDHELHSRAVAGAGRNDELARRIQKLLDARHRVMIHRFAGAGTEEAVRALWKEALKGTDIPGAYWAVMTHPRTNDAIARDVFGDIHMLSHLVGAANRADIRHLRELEERNAELEEMLARQQSHLRVAIVERDERVRALTESLSRRIEQQGGPVAAGPQDPTLERLVADLRKDLDAAIRRRERDERRVSELVAARAADERKRRALEAELLQMSRDLAVAEAQAADVAAADALPDAPQVRDRTILFVGGRPHQVARLKAWVERGAGAFLHHDGGIEERDSRLAGLIGRADVAAFPVDCISHAAALSLKRLCRQAGKPYMPLRGSGWVALLQALRALESGAASPA